MTSQLPVIDFAAADAPQAFTRSLHDTGFAVLRNHPLAYAMVQGIYAEWAEFFRSKAKHAYDYDRQTHAGYFSPAISETAKGQNSKITTSEYARLAFCFVTITHSMMHAVIHRGNQ